MGFGGQPRGRYALGSGARQLSFALGCLDVRFVMKRGRVIWTGGLFAVDLGRKSPFRWLNPLKTLQMSKIIIK
jgi:hypothetical protein